MLVFDRLRFKNFLSFGNQFTEIDITEYNTNLIVGKNGAGKSTFLDALIFVLFGKPFREINKPQLVNTINVNKCLVEVEFASGPHKYMVRRGIKPNVFEIYKDGEMLEQLVHAQYQSLLENEIIKMNYIAFTQIVVLGKATYTPFMRLTTPKRRALIEEFLGLSVFSEMKKNLKEYNDTNANDIRTAQADIASLNNTINLKNVHLTSLNTNKEEIIQGLNSDIIEYEQAIVDIQEKAQELIEHRQKLESRRSTKDYNAIRKDYEQYSIQLNEKLSAARQRIAFFDKNSHCPTCKRDIGEDFKDTEVSEKQVLIEKVTVGLDKVVKKLDHVNADISVQDELDRQLRNVSYEQQRNQSEIASYTGRINKATLAIQVLVNKNDNINGIVNEIHEHEHQLVIKQKELDDAFDTKKYYVEIGRLLVDDGIKALIIKKYLPIFNKLINKYLTLMEIHVNFTLDEQFNEKILSRHRDKFTYNSFSEGEKLRIDLALLLAWRDISKMKNSKDTNLIIMDEVFDSSMDQDGVDAFIAMLPDMDQVHLFIISHTPEKLFDKFENTLNVKKSGNFSIIR